VVREEQPEQETEVKQSKLVTPELKAIPTRNLREATCAKFGYGVVKKNGVLYHVAPYTVKGEVVAQKIRSPDKKFRWIGAPKGVELFGQHLWKAGGKRLIITEGEIDALSVSQVQDNKWPVVSVPNGAAGAEESVRLQLEYVSSFERVDICFDSDDAGRKAAIAVALLLPPGKAHITHLSKKDPNEYLKEGLDQDLRTALWNSQPYRPDGIISVTDVKADDSVVTEIMDYPWACHTTALFGRRFGELCIHTSGSGMGKSTVMREMVHYDIYAGNRPGLMFLEENATQTVQSLISLELNKPVRKILAARAVNASRLKSGKKAIPFDVKDDLTDEQYQVALQKLRDTGLALYDHFGSVDSTALIQKMEYMVKALGCKVIYLDHLSIVISGLESGNERKDIDVLMTNLRSFVERTQCRVEAVCHLTKPDGTPYEEGGQISLKDLRGSGSLYHLADGVLGYERDQQNPDLNIANTIAVRSLKDRFSGVTGIVNALRFSKETGRLAEIPWDRDEDGKLCFEGAPSVGKTFKNALAEDDVETDVDILGD
jgi:twinkle protein